MLALLGWNPGDNREILSKEELIKEFSFERVNKSGAKFDPEKTKWFNQQYLRMRTNEELANSVTPLLEEKGIKKDPAFVVEFCRLVKEKAHFITEFYELGSYFFVAPTTFDEKVMTKKWNENSKTTYSKLTEKLNVLPTWTIDSIHHLFSEVEPELGKIDMQLVRVLTTGVAGGAQLFDMLALIGKEEVINRLNSALAKLQ
jgi:glutamyl-tRNA synthetase